ncbi:MAG: kinase-like domain-containing protein, partial [Monoraphidium minutum]
MHPPPHHHTHTHACTLTSCAPPHPPPPPPRKVAVKRLHALDGSGSPGVLPAPASGSGSGASGSGASGSGSGRSGGRGGGGGGGAFLEFFDREIAILASIRHPNVVNFIGACHRAPAPCLVTEFCARGPLDALVHGPAGGALSTARRVEFAIDVARGMACLHAQAPPVIHRDLKTANLLVSARYEVKVADFGLSRIKDATHLFNSRAGMEGTVEYCAPEVLRGESYTEKADVYSFGVVLWELLARARPYSDLDVPIYMLI